MPGGSIRKTGKTLVLNTKANTELRSQQIVSTAANNVVETGKANGVFFADYEPKEVTKNKKPLTFTVSLFFDGTRNNRNNTDARKADNDVYKKNKDEVSFQNGYSNVGILERYNFRDPDQRKLSIYIEGIGTEDNKGDSLIGSAIGMGSTGIPAKVKKGINSMCTEIYRMVDPKTEYIEKIEVDAFGFSRGAAAARNFIHLAQDAAAKQLQVAKTKVKYRFVGLFDTVSSYGLSFSNDTEDLGMAIGGNAKKVVQLTAADEHRKVFSLTNIESSIKAGIGYELELPGAHSDIGGGYEAEEEEERLLETKLEGQGVMAGARDAIIREGWYTKAQLSERTQPMGTDYYTLVTKLYGTRTVAGGYQYIPMNIMKQLAEKNGMQFNDMGKRFEVPPDMQQAKSTLVQQAVAGDGAHKKAITLPPEQLRPLRNRYLHRSANPSNLAMLGRYKDGKPYRIIYPG